MLGAGTVGVFCAAVAREFGAAVVVSVDIMERKLSFARRFIGECVGEWPLLIGLLALKKKRGSLSTRA